MNICEYVPIWESASPPSPNYFTRKSMFGQPPVLAPALFRLAEGPTGLKQADRCLYFYKPGNYLAE